MSKYQGSLKDLLYVSNLERSVSFYAEKLGFSLEGYWDGEEETLKQTYAEAHSPGYAELKAGKARVGLHVWDDEGSLPAGAISLSLEVENVDSLYQELTEKGIPISKPQNFPCGQRMIFIKDPDGHPWSFYTTFKS